MSIISEALKKTERSSKAALPHPLDNIKAPGFKMGESLIKKSKVIVFSAIILFVLFGALVFYLLNRHTQFESSKMIAVKKEAEKPPEEPTVVTVEEEAAVERETAIPAVIIPPSTFKEVDELLNLSGIMYTSEKPLAIINNDIWTEGETVGKFKIIKIGYDFVKVSSDDGEFVIKLKR